MTTFQDLGLVQPILAALTSEGYERPTPIQEQAIPHLLQGKDLLGIAQTGTGKTAAFGLPILDKLARDKKQPPRHGCRALILSPTRELASQIAENLRSYGRNLKLRISVVFGGVSGRPQALELARGVDVLVATPGRLIDHLEGRAVNLSHVEVFVLDEADQMLDMGFIHAIRRIVPLLPRERQNLFFSATMPKEIGALASDLLRDPVQVSVTPVATTAERIDQRIFFVETARKRNLLIDLLREGKMGRTLVFTRTKHGADRVVRHLEDAGIPSAAIHGNKSQSQRERALGDFRAGRRTILVATDIAARGIDVDGVTHVLNFDLPNVPESYVHRIGRTARAGAEGSAISFCDAEERAYLRDIEKLTRQSIPSEDRRLPETVTQEAEQIARGGAGKNGGAARNGGRPNRGGKPGQGRPAQNRSGQARAAGQGRHAEGRFGEGRFGEGRHAEGRASEGARHGKPGGAAGRGPARDRDDRPHSRPESAGRGHQGNRNRTRPAG